MSKKKFPVIPSSTLEALCKVIGDTNNGLTGSEIAKAIEESKMQDISPTDTKWRRLYNACSEVQSRTGCSNNILTLISNAYSPALFIVNREVFEERRSEVNKVLSFAGLQLAENGKFRPVEKSQTISDAQQKATLLMTKLESRNVHQDVIKYCKAELLVDNYFHAVFEATKSVADKLRNLTGLIDDGDALITATFNINNPLLKINDLRDDSKKSEQKGFANLLRGLFGMFRNTPAHVPSISWVIQEQDAIDIMTMLSMAHRRIDNAILAPIV